MKKFDKISNPMILVCVSAFLAGTEIVSIASALTIMVILFGKVVSKTAKEMGGKDFESIF